MKDFSSLLAEQFGSHVLLNEIDISLIDHLKFNPVGLSFKEHKPLSFETFTEYESIKAMCVRPHCFTLKEFLCILHTMSYKYEEKCVFLIRINNSIFSLIYYKSKKSRFIDILKPKEALKRIKEGSLNLKNSLVFIKDYKK